MSAFKRTLAGLIAILSVFSLVGCDNSNGGGSSAETTITTNTMNEDDWKTIAEIASQDENLTGELTNKKIIWMSNWDINPDSSGKEEPIELAIFKSRYQGVVETKLVDWDVRYDQLAQAIIGGVGVDFFPAGDMDAFPKGAIRGMFVPVDDYIDFSTPLWSDIKDLNDSLVWNGKHYIVCTSMDGSNCAVIYNKDTISEYGLDDPAELFEDGEWTWDTFEKCLKAFCAPEEQRYGIDGYWCEAALSKTTGVPYLGLEDGKLVNNLKDPNLERVQTFMYDLFHSGLTLDKANFNWEEQPSFIGEGKSLFYPCGLWALYSTPDQWKKTFGDNAFFVPMPKDPEADAYYIPAGVEGYVMCANGQNPEGVSIFANCKRVATLNEQAKTLGHKQLTENYGWTDDMIAMKAEMDEIALANPVFDFYAGVTKDITTILDSGEDGIRCSLALGGAWNEVVTAAYDVVEMLIQDVNDNPIQSGTSFD